jgi:6-phosphofructokinase
LYRPQIDKCFGFDTAVEQAQEALLAAKVEAGSAYHGIGVVKLMGRSSGFIAMQASLASGAPNCRVQLAGHLSCGTTPCVIVIGP